MTALVPDPTVVEPLHLPDDGQPRVLVFEPSRVGLVVLKRLVADLGCRVDVLKSPRAIGEYLDHHDVHAFVFGSGRPPCEGRRAAVAMLGWAQSRGRIAPPAIELVDPSEDGASDGPLLSAVRTLESESDYDAVGYQLQRSGDSEALRVVLHEALRAAWGRPAQPTGALDRAVLDSLRALDPEGDGAFLGQLAAALIASAPSLLDRMGRGVAAGDAAELRAGAHALKSSAAQLGAMTLSVHCAELEEAALAGGMDDVSAVFDQAMSAWKLALAELGALLPGSGPAVRPPDAPGSQHSGPQRAVTKLAGRRSEAGATHVLVIDDDPTVRTFVEGSLRRVGIGVTCAGGGQEGLSLFRQRRPDAVLLDVMMDDMDGFATCLELRRSEGGASVPVLFMTGRNDVRAVRRAYDVGATDFISKPFHPEMLQNRVRFLLRASSAIEGLRRNEAHLAAAQRIVGLGNWVLDLDHQRFECSEEAARMFGLADHPPASFEELHRWVGAEQRERVIEGIRRAKERGESFDHRVTVDLHQDLRVVDERVELLRDAAGHASIVLGVVHDVTDRTRAEAEVHRLAFYDDVTGLPNRATFSQSLTECALRCLAESQRMAVVFIDLDRFKRINDTLGHGLGDALLHSIGMRLKGALRDRPEGLGKRPMGSGDLVARFGGDEFTVLLGRVAGSKEARTVAERLLATLKEPFVLDGQELFVTASAGVTVFPDDCQDPQDLIRRADIAMYLAKEAGGNALQLYMDQPSDSPQADLQVENELRHALERGEFEMHYQPRFELEGPVLAGAEALIRWRHPTKGLVSPGIFIPTAEQSGLIVPIGEWVLRESCRQWHEWTNAGIVVGRISVNLSARQLFGEGLVDTVRRALEDTGMSPQLLELEVTESMVMKRLDATIAVLHELRAMGVSLAVDDFGTGHASLNYVRRFPIDVLKIDRSFVMDVATDPEDAVIATVIIELGKALGLRVVAEGVEDEDQLEFLRSRGCHEVQGYLLGRPMHPDPAVVFFKDLLRKSA